MKFKRIFLIILDSLGVGEADDASSFNDSGANTLGHIKENCHLYVPNLEKIGLLNTLNLSDNQETEAYYTIAKPKNKGKDSLNGHYEIIGTKSDIAYDTFNSGFPFDLLNMIENITGRHVLGNIVCNDNISIINELGERQQNYGSLIVYTSSDSDIQIAAHEDVIPIEKLHEYCKKIRDELSKSDFKIARVIARPFNGTKNNYKLINSARCDFTIKIKTNTLLSKLEQNKYDIIGIGKVNDLYDRVGITKKVKATTNTENTNKLLSIMDKDFTGLCISNLSDFDLMGHFRDKDKYAQLIEEFDVELPMIINKLELNDLLIITADHGNDSTFSGFEHTRENLPVIVYSRAFKNPRKLDSLDTLADIGATIADNFEVATTEIGNSFLDKLS